MEITCKNIRSDWDRVLNFVASRFQIPNPQLEGVLMLIGVQELQKANVTFNKNDKINLIHVAVCTVLSYQGYYKRSHTDADGWPHFVLMNSLPQINPQEQQSLIQTAILRYFEIGGYL